MQLSDVVADSYMDDSEAYLCGISIAVLRHIHGLPIADLRASDRPLRFDMSATRFDVEEC